MAGERPRLAQLHGFAPVLALPLAASDDTGLVAPTVGLMFWTLLAFVTTMLLLRRFALPRIRKFLDERAELIRRQVEEAEKTRDEADELLAEYRRRLTEAREQADDIIARARKAAEAVRAEAASEGKAKREELVAAARKDIETETRRSLERIRKEVADLTVMATEKVTRKTLTGDDHRRLVEEALSEVDFSALAPDGARSAGDGRPATTPGERQTEA